MPLLTLSWFAVPAQLTMTWATSAVSSLISAAWQGAILAACVAVVLRLVPRMSAAARSLVWVNVFVLLLGLHAVPYFRSAYGGSWSSQQAAFRLGLTWCYATAGLWAALTVVRGGLLISSALRLRTLAMRAVPIVPDSALLPLLQVNALFGKVTRKAEICTSADVQRPSVLGFFHPRILVPVPVLERLTATELQQVVLHEMEHLRRGDDWTNLLQKLALVVFPLNPALLWVERRLCAERELACDDSVLRSSCGRKAYAICLTHLAEYSMLRHGLGLALGAWERQSELVRRVHRILRRPGQSLNRLQSFALTSALTFAVLACAFGLSLSPKLVIFERVGASPTQTLAMQVTKPQEPPTAAMLGAKLRSTSAAGHLQLAKAIMSQPEAAASRPSRSMYGTIQTVATRRQAATLRTVRQQVTPVHRRAWMVMTQWTETGAEQHLVWTVSEDSAASFAAIRTANGWVFIQI